VRANGDFGGSPTRGQKHALLVNARADSGIPVITAPWHFPGRDWRKAQARTGGSPPGGNGQPKASRTEDGPLTRRWRSSPVELRGAGRSRGSVNVV